jgi:hypothetical protein
LGLEDDVFVLQTGETDHWRLAVFEGLAGLLCTLAVLLIVGREGVRLLGIQLLGPRSPRLGVEVARAAGWAVPAAGVLGAGLWAFFTLEATASLAEPIAEALEDHLLVPLPLALGGGVYIAMFLALFALRLRRPLEAAAEDRSESSLEGGEAPGR